MNHQLSYNMTNAIIHGMLMKEHSLAIQDLYVELDLPGKNKGYNSFGEFVTNYNKVLEATEIALLRSSKVNFDETTDKCVEIAGTIHLLMALHSDHIEKIKLELADRIHDLCQDGTGFMPIHRQEK
jgi:hypothetical protein